MTFWAEYEPQMRALTPSARRAQIDDLGRQLDLITKIKRKLEEIEIEETAIGEAAIATHRARRSSARPSES